MGSILGPFLDIEPKPNVWDRGDDILSYTLDNIAQDVQTRLKSRLDTGADLYAAVRASSLTVRNEAGRLVITTQDSGDEKENTTIDDLFRSTNPTPYIEQNRLIFRQIREQEIERSNEQSVKSSIEEAVKINLDRHIEDGIKKVIADNPELSR